MQGRTKIYYEGVGDVFVPDASVRHWLSRGWVLADARTEVAEETLLSDEEESYQDVVRDTEEI